ncbi:MAG TPA: 6,7-dimethyl-8-ribityllumazine synthase [Acidimicrobiales bacterium]|jgi:6,7-dimethyl-8-ribityllumazine synthase|nr:6,7-dimethyl-8-ribityllumazine synthase [Acidimicrobiales bacterium]
MRQHRGSLDGRSIRVAIVASRFNERVVRLLVDGAVDALARTGVADDDLDVTWVPGAFEIPLAAATVAAGGAVDVVVCVGAVIRGETPHFDYVASAVAQGVARAALDTGVPITFGVLTTDDAAQAEARAGGKVGNKGADAALAAVEMVQVLRSLRSG